MEVETSAEDELRELLSNFDSSSVASLGSELHDRESSHAMSRLGGFLALAAVPMALTFSESIIHDSWARIILYLAVTISLTVWLWLAWRSYSMIRIWKILASGRIGDGISSDRTELESRVYSYVISNRRIKWNSTFAETLLPPILVIGIAIVVAIELSS